MSDTPAQFWLLTGDVPAGPFTVKQVHAELAAGRATWQTPACAVGGHEWRPLVQTPGVGPSVPVSPPEPSPPPAESAVPVLPTTTGTTPAKSTTPDRTVERVGVLIGIGLLIGGVALVGWLGYLVYNWVRPYTPLEVCEKLGEAKTAAEAKKYATPRLHKFLDESFKDQTPDDPNFTFDWTRESDGPMAGVKLVGFRMSMWVPEAGRRVPMEGQVRLVQSGGWKADDLVITGAEGVVMDGPVSLVDEFRRESLRNAAGKKAMPSNLTPPPVQRKGIAGAFDSVWNNFGLGGIIAVVVVIAIVLGVREEMKKKRS